MTDRSSKEYKDAAKARREARTQKKQQQTSSYTTYNDSQLTSGHRQTDLSLLTDSQIIQELRRLPIIETDWDENFTRSNKEMFLRLVHVDIEEEITNQGQHQTQKEEWDTQSDQYKKDNPFSDRQSKQLSTMCFDAMYRVRAEGHPFYQRGNGLVQPDEETRLRKRERSEKRRELRKQNNTTDESNSEIDLNNPLLRKRHVVRSNSQRTIKSKEERERNKMKLLGPDNLELRLKVRSKGYPKYATDGTGDTRPITVDGKDAVLVMRAVTEDSTHSSKRVGLGWKVDKEDKFFYVDDADVLAKVQALSDKKPTKFTIAVPEEKPAKEPKKAKAETNPKGNGTAEPKKAKKAEKKQEKVAGIGI